MVIQDPVWERSFPEVGGVALPFLDHTSGKFVSVRLTDREAAWMRDENERTAAELLTRFRMLDLGPVLVTTSDRGDIFQAFLEWAEIYGHRSGTLWAPVADALEAGRDVVLEIDVQGSATVRERVPEAVLVFLAPPSLGELERRLRARHTESDAQLARRLSAAREEMATAARFDRVVVNDEVELAANEVAAIIAGEREGRARNARPADRT